MGQFQGGMGHDDPSQSPQRAGQMAGMQQAQYSPYAQQMPQYYYPTSPFSPPGQQQFFPGGSQGMSMYADRRGSLQSPQGTFFGSAIPGQGNRQGQGMSGYSDMYGNAATLSAGEGMYRCLKPETAPLTCHVAIQRPSSGGSMGSIPRGPPRKPKQSGHALWVGNLPPGTTVIDLKDHFSRDATKDIESLFLISKSNCAFVNYRSEASCVAAMQRFHDSRFHGVRLVCRLRRGSTAPSGVPSAPSAMAGSIPSITSPVQVPSVAPSVDGEVEEPEEETDRAATEPPSTNEKVQNKYFVVKSLTLQDLELSVRNGIWATQSHNEQSLNKAFEVSGRILMKYMIMLTINSLPRTSTSSSPLINLANTSAMLAWLLPSVKTLPRSTHQFQDTNQPNPPQTHPR